MAKLLRLPNLNIIRHFKGAVDFYLWKDIPCARKWPHYPKRVPHGDEAANQQAFAYAQHHWLSQPPFLRAMFIDMASGLSVIPRDIFTRCYLNGNPL